MAHLQRSAPPPRSGASTACIQSAFRDVTNHYLSANKENIPPAGAFFGGLGGSGSGGKGSGCKVAPPLPRSVVSEIDHTCCGTPVQTDLALDAKVGGDVDALFEEQQEKVLDEAALVGNFATQLCSPTLSLASPTNGLSTGAINSQKAMEPTTACVKAGSVGVSSASTTVQTPLQSASSLQNASSVNATITAAKLMQQRHRSLSGAHAAPAGSGPFHLQGKAGDAPAATSTGASVSGQSSLHCTPSGARRSAAAAAAATAAARALSETPTRMEDISFYLNNSFESGSESPTHDGVAGAYGAARTPHRTFDLQQAVEEMLRGCFDSSTPAKCSDASGVSPHGSRKRQQRQLETEAAPAVPFSAYTALDSLFAAPSLSKAAGAGNPWGQGYALTSDRTPERFAEPRAVFAESDDEESGNSPQSEAVTRAGPAAGVRRDPLVYFSTSSMPSANSAAYFDPSPSLEDNSYAPAPQGTRMTGAAADAQQTFRALSVPHTGATELHSDGGCSGPDMLAMLAAAVQQQTPRSAVGSAELDSQTFSERDGEAAIQPVPPPSYHDGHQPSRFPRRDGASSAATATDASHAPQPIRRSHHLPQVKAAAGSLIAVSGRRVPVDKLHLLSLSSGDETGPVNGCPKTAGCARQASRGGGGGGSRSQAQSPSTQPHQQHHVEGPSMRRVPKASVVTVTRTPVSGVSASSGNGQHTQGGGAGALSASASLPSSSSQTSLADGCTTRTATTVTRMVVPGPSARRIPPTANAGTSMHSRQGSVAANSDGSSVHRSTDLDVVAVLQFSKGQTMRFLTNLSPAARKAAQAALQAEVGSSNGSKSGRTAAACALLMHAPLASVEVGKAYLAHVYRDQSPYENVAFEDVGVCVRLYTPSSSASTPAAAEVADSVPRDHVDGVLLREVDVVACEEDRQQHEQALQQQTGAYIECERQFKFSGLPFQLESIYFTFDGSVCVVFYRVVAPDASASAATYRFSNTPRVVRELQFHLSCRVFLKQC